MGCRAHTAAGRTTTCLCRRIIQVTPTASSLPANPTSRAEEGMSSAGSSQAPSRRVVTCTRTPSPILSEG